MKKYDELKSAVVAAGDEKQIYFVNVLGAYLDHLTNNFEKLCSQGGSLIEEDLELFSDFVATKPEFRDQLAGQSKRLTASILMDDVAYIARHVWEFKNVEGQVITGNFLHALAPDIFEGDTEMSLEETISYLSVLRHVMG